MFLPIEDSYTTKFEETVGELDGSFGYAGADCAGFRRIWNADDSRNSEAWGGVDYGCGGGQIISMIIGMASLDS